VFAKLNKQTKIHH